MKPARLFIKKMSFAGHFLFQRLVFFLVRFYFLIHSAGLGIQNQKNKEDE